MAIQKGTKGGRSKLAKYTVDQLLEKATENINQLNPEGALVFLHRALELSPNDTEIMDVAAELLLETNKPEEAFKLLRKSTQLAPDKGFTKWMYLAQLCEGTESLNCLKKGVMILTEEINKPENAENRPDLLSQLCQAYCSIAEMYTTDLCELPEAESECESCLMKSLSLNENHIETLIMLGSCRMSQCRVEDAEQALVKASQLINSIKLDHPELLPNYESREFLAKMLLEIPNDQTYKERNNYCLDILDTILQEDDENEEIWYYMANCYYNIHKYTLAKEFGEGCRTRVQQRLKQQNIPEIQAQLEAINQLLSEIHKDINSGKVDSEDENDKEEIKELERQEEAMNEDINME